MMKRSQSFPLRLSPSIREEAKLLAQKEGISFNSFVCLALAEKLSRMEHEHWLKRGRPELLNQVPTQHLTARRW
jgi:hypothetical protein